MDTQYRKSNRQARRAAMPSLLSFCGTLGNLIISWELCQLYSIIGVVFGVVGFMILGYTVEGRE